MFNVLVTILPCTNLLITVYDSTSRMLWCRIFISFYYSAKYLNSPKSFRCSCHKGEFLTNILQLWFSNLMLWMHFSRIAGPMCSVLDPAMVTTVNFFHGNEFYTARRAKLAWLQLAWHWAFLWIQDGGSHHLGYMEISHCWPWLPTWSCNTSFLGWLRVGSPFLELFCGYLVKVKPEVKCQIWQQNNLYFCLIAECDQPA